MTRIKWVKFTAFFSAISSAGAEAIFQESQKNPRGTSGSAGLTPPHENPLRACYLFNSKLRSAPPMPGYWFTACLKGQVGKYGQASPFRKKRLNLACLGRKFPFESTWMRLPLKRMEQGL
jgi:hypothetical protein